ncbi:hypothetical protein WME98_52930 [Sorangium sp. So ce296]|uniref:hypothetical protein n=1 Tax=Sorangium sp. So ce296 TaxID=3133296 RepID=UPI003F5FA281
MVAAPSYSHERHIKPYAIRPASRKNLRARKRGELVVIESGPDDDPIPHARLRRDTVQLWRLEIATHTGRWEPTGIRAPLKDILDVLVHDFPWVLTPVV